MSNTNKVGAGDAIFAPLTTKEKERAASPRSNLATTASEVLAPLPQPKGKFPSLFKIRHPVLGVPDECYPYPTADDLVLFYLLRWDANPQAGRARKEIRPYTFGRLIARSDDVGEGRSGSEGWFFKFPPPPLPLYNLTDLIGRPGKPVLVCEGEKAADAASRLLPGYVCTTSCGGSRRADKTNWAPMVGRYVVVWPDNDKPGRHYAQQVASNCANSGAAGVGIVAVPEGWPEGWDLADDMPPQVDMAAIAVMVAGASPWTAPERNNRSSPGLGLSHQGQVLVADASAAADDRGTQQVRPEQVVPRLPELLVDAGNLPMTASVLAGWLREVPNLYERGLPVEVVLDRDSGAPVAVPLDSHSVARLCHLVCTPVQLVQGSVGPSRRRLTLHLTGWRRFTCPTTADGICAL